MTKDKILGTFEINSGVARISDPCYDTDIWCAGVLNDVNCGTWHGIIKHETLEGFLPGRFDDLATDLVAIHDDYIEDDISDWEHTEIHVGVDSGQSGIYDDKYYNTDSSVSNMNDNYNDYYSFFDRFDDSVTLSDIILKKSLKTLEDVNISDEEKEKMYDLIKIANEQKEYKKSRIGRGRINQTRWFSKPSQIWYGINCALTNGFDNPLCEDIKEEDLIKSLGGVMPFGVVSVSGYGDGGYKCYVSKKDDKIIAIKIVFISDDDE